MPSLQRSVLVFPPLLLQDLLLLAVERTLTREQVLNALKGPGAAFGSPVAVEKTEGVEAEDSAAGSSRTAEVVPLGVAAEASDASSSRAAAAPAAAEPEAAAAVPAAAEPEVAAAPPAAAEPEVAAPGSHAVAAASVAAAPAAAAQAAERSGSSAAAAGASNRAVERGRAGFGFGRNTAERQQKREEAERQKEEREKEAIRLVQETGSARWAWLGQPADCRPSVPPKTSPGRGSVGKHGRCTQPNWPLPLHCARC